MASHRGWIKRRARRLQRFFGVDRRIAVFSANEDWRAFKGIVKADPPRSCDQLGVCQLHATGRERCDSCPYRNVPRNAPPLTPRVLLGPAWQRRGWRAALASFYHWLVGPTPW